MQERKKQKWMIAAKRADFNAWAARFSIDPVTARLLRNRDLTNEDDIEKYLNGDLKDLYEPELMKDLLKAAMLLEEKVKEQKRIRIMGDYDGDGIMSSYILCRGLKRLGAMADVKIPNRMTQGYGIHESLVREAKEDGVDTILTCDNGIAAAEQVGLAAELGMTVIVTDHHEVPKNEKGEDALPPAAAVVNPHRQDCPYPFKDLCGAGVAFKLICCMYARAGIEKESEELSAYAAIATITDVMELKDENRILVREGLRRLRRTSNKGLLALMKENGILPGELSSYHIGFVIGPCLNASGRLYTAMLALQLLFEEEEQKAGETAKELVALNTSRKAMTEQGVEAAMQLVEASSLKDDDVLVVYLPGCHESIAGIIAGRIREAYYRPVFVLTDGESCVKGSGRSIESYSMFEKMSECKELMLKFGGHPMAAGLSIEKDKVEIFRKRLNEKSGLTADDLVEKITIDVAMPMSYVSKKLIGELELLKPFGKGNEKPVFAEKGLRVISKRLVGQNRNVLKLQLLTRDGCKAEAVCFREAQAFDAWLDKKEIFSVLYYPAINSFRGRENIEFQILGYC